MVMLMVMTSPSLAPSPPGLPGAPEVEFWFHCANSTTNATTSNLQTLASKLADVNASSDIYNHKTCLHFAVEAAQVETLSFLLSLPGIDVNRHDSEHQSPLALACRLRHHRMMVMLLRDPRVDINGGWGRNLNAPILWAAKNLDLCAARLLIASGKQLFPIDWKSFPWRDRNLEMTGLLERHLGDSPRKS